MAKQKYPMTGTTTTDGTTRKGKSNKQKSGKLQAKRERKRNEADERMYEHKSMTLEQRIDKAKSRRGESKREIARLQKQLAERPPELAPVKTVKKKVYSKPSKS
jgi:hypothetical protein